MLYFEDVPVEEPSRLGETTVSKEEIVEFAERFDPLPMHVDEEAAEDGPFDGLIASGYHTLCLANGVVVSEYTRNLAAVAGLGIDEVRWYAPVRPGDTIVVYRETVEKRVSESRPGEGILTGEVTVVREAEQESEDDVVMTYRSSGLIERTSAE